MDKNLEYKVSVNQSGNAVDKLNEVGAAADRANEKVEKLRKPVGSRGGGRASVAKSGAFDGMDSNIGMSVAAQAKQDKDNEGILGKRIALVAAAMYTVGKGFEAGAVSVNAYTDSMATNGQRVRSISEALIPGLSSIRHFFEAVNGVANRIGETDRAAALHQGQTNIGERGRQRLGAVDADSMLASGRVNGIYGNPLGGWRGGEFDRSSHQGQIRYGEYAQRQESADALTMARREQDATRSAERGQSRVTDSAQEGLQESERRRDAALRRLDRQTSYENRTGYHARDDRNQAIRDVQTTQNEVSARATTLEAERLRLREASVRAAQAEGAADQARIAVIQREVDLLRQRERRMSSAQISLGSMTPAQRMAGTNAAIALQQGGIANAPRELIDRARTVAPGMVDRMAENAGAAHARELARRGIDDYQADFTDGQTLGQVRQRVDRVQADVRVQVDLNTTQMAQAVVAAIQAFRESVVSEVRVELRGFEVNLRAQNLLRSNGGS